MKIFVLPGLSARPLPYVYPPHNEADYGVEQDFVVYIGEKPQLLTEDSGAADWHYLPVHWTRLYVHNDAPDTPGLLHSDIEKRILRVDKTFTICQYDNGPLDYPSGAVKFLASRRDGEGIDIPLMSFPHKIPSEKPSKRWLASFMGRLGTHPSRRDMARALGSHKLIDIHDANRGTVPFVKQIVESYVALCPRGYGGSSFRFFEAMSLGVCPMLIGDIDVRPFKKWIDWEECSAYARTAEEARGLLEETPPKEWLWRGDNARQTYDNQLAFGKWCGYVIKELEDVDRLGRGNPCRPATARRNTHWGPQGRGAHTLLGSRTYQNYMD